MVTIEEIAKDIGYTFSLMTTSEIEYFKEVATVAMNLTSAEECTLNACYSNGPLEDGDVPSKSARDSLLDKGFVSKVIVKGEDGYNACTYKGRLALSVAKSKLKLNLIENIRSKSTILKII